MDIRKINSSRGLIYPKKLEDIMKKNHYIPRQLHYGEHFKLYHRYFNAYTEELFKVIEILNIDNDLYYIIHVDDNYSSAIPEPSSTEINYEILKDYYDIVNQSIINSDKSFTGAEIKYWFVVNEIDLSDDYYGYKKYFDKSYKYFILDSRHYYVRYYPESKNKCIIMYAKNKNYSGGSN